MHSYGFSFFLLFSHPSIDTSAYSMSNPFVGVWQRTHLYEPHDTLLDTTTTVLWIQSQSFFVDLRIPAELTAPQSPITTHQRLRIKGFAGIGEYDAATHRYTWHRAIDYQPPGARPDIGLMCLDGPDVLWEDGVDGDDYKERWVRIHTPEDSDHVDGSCERLADGRLCIRVRSGAWTALAVSRSAAVDVFRQVATGTYASLAEYQRQSGASDAQMQLMCDDGFVCLGRDGVVLYATRADMVGKPWASISSSSTAL
jgi:hypothetical protein